MKIRQEHFDAMMNGTRCKFWDDDPNVTDIDKLTAIDNDSIYPFFLEKSVWYKNCEPLKTEVYVKEWFDIAKQLYDEWVY